MTQFDRAVQLFGKSYDSPDVLEFLTDLPEHKLGKPNDGSQHAVSARGGFELAFTDEHAVGGRRQNRILTAVFLYSGGVQQFQGCQWSLPFGFNFQDQRSKLLEKIRPDRTWVIGEGRVQLNHPSPSHDTWVSAEFNLSAHYSDDAATISYFVVTLPKPLRVEDEWKPQVTWQTLALDPARKLEAIKLYKAERTMSTAEAKLAIEEFLLTREKR